MQTKMFGIILPISFINISSQGFAIKWVDTVVDEKIKHVLLLLNPSFKII